MNAASSAEDREFEFLDRYDRRLRQKLDEATALANIYPDASATASRTFAEILVREVGRRHGVAEKLEDGQNSEDLFDYIKRLHAAGHIPRDLADALHTVRRTGNRGAHKGSGATAMEANASVKSIRRLASWFHAQDTAANPLPKKTGNTSQPYENSAVSAGSNVYEFKSQARPASPSSTQAKRRPAGAGLNPARDVSIFIAVVGLVLIGIFWISRPSGNFVSDNVQSPPPAVSATAANTPVVQQFGSPQTYTVVPGGHLADVNERNGPGWTYGIVQKFPRGTTVVGTGRALDTDGLGWIQLADGTGFIKETVLAPVATPTPSNSDMPGPTDTPTETTSVDTSVMQPDPNGVPDSTPPAQPDLVQYNVCPPPGMPLPCQLVMAPPGTTPEYPMPPDYQPPPQPVMQQPLGGQPEISLSVRIGPSRRQHH